MKNLSNKKILLSSITIMMVTLIMGFTFSFWTRNFIQTGQNRITSDCFNIEYDENVDGVTLSNAYPQRDSAGMKNTPYTITVTNSCKTHASYTMVLNKMSGATLADSHVKIAVNDTNKLLTAYTTTATTVSGASSAYTIHSGVIVGGETKEFKIRGWMEENTSEADGVNKTVSYKVTVDAKAGGTFSLASKILDDSRVKQKNSLYSYETLSLNQTDETVNLDGNNGSNRCYTSSLDNIFFQTDNHYLEMSSYECPEWNENDNRKPSDFIGWYTFDDGDMIGGKNVYKIKTVSNNIITKADHYVRDSSDDGSIVNSFYDDDGRSYVYQGNVSNNYVNFANKLWRIVRVNGDGSIRITLNNSIGEHLFNDNANNPKYVGYTYDNESSCTKSSPCSSNYDTVTDTFINNKNVTNSSVKAYLENWYVNNLSNYDNKITLTTYCNPTEYEEIDYTYRGSWLYDWYAMDDSLPELRCDGTSQNYGGTYKLKIGLITADELQISTTGNEPDFITPYYYGWTMTPYNYKTDIASVTDTVPNYQYAGIDVNYPYDPVYPVINLVSDIQVVSGNGTEDNPYVIE